MQRILARQGANALVASHTRSKRAPRRAFGCKALLNESQLQLFARDGYLVIPNFASPKEVTALQQRTAELVEGFDPSTSQSVFSTKNQKERTDQQFLDSASCIDFFWEEGAMDDQGRLTKPKHLAINKIGHAQHDLDPVYRAWSRSAKIAELMADLGFQRPLPVQSMTIFKQPGIGGEVVPHQDSSFLYTDPPSCIGVWLALEDATRDNGCLWTLPGGHTAGLYRRFLRSPEGSVSFDDSRSWHGAAAAGAGDMPGFNGSFIPVEVKAGTLVVLHGSNVHLSQENRSPLSRHAFAMHVVEGAPGFSWAADNWLQRPEGLPFEPLYDRTHEATAA